MLKKTFSILLTFLYIFCILALNIKTSAVYIKSSYIIRGFSYGFYEILNDTQASCTSISSQGEESVIFCKSGYEISKSVTSKSYLYILVESGEYHAIFTLLRNGLTDSSYIPGEDLNPSSFTATDKYLYFISNDKTYVLSINRNTQNSEKTIFQSSVNNLFCYNEKVYAVTADFIYCLDNPNVPIQCDIPAFGILEPVFYGNIFIDSNSDVYLFTPSNGFKYIKTLNYSKVFVLNDIYYGINGNTIYKLSENGSIIGKYTFSDNIDDVAVNGDKIALLYSSIVTIISDRDFSSAESSNPNTFSQNPTSDTFTDYKTDDDYIIVPQGTTVAVLKKHINTVQNSSLNFYNDNNKAITTGTLGTGFSLYYYENSKLKLKYTIIVIGDVTGEGSVNTRDKRRLTDYLLGKLDLTAPQTYAANIDNNDIVDSLDLLLLVKSYS